MTINEWPVSQRPREKLLHHGAHSLSDEELLAILLRTGMPGKTALDIARELLLQFNDLYQLFNATANELSHIRGLGTAKITQLLAVLELGKRYLQQPIRKREVIHTSHQIKQLLCATLKAKEREIFVVIYLDNRHSIITQEELFQGTLTHVNVHLREILRQALKHNAAAIIVAHNHPAGNPKPSEADISLTRELKTALELCDIRLLDHIVVGGSEVVCMSELGLL